MKTKQVLRDPLLHFVFLGAAIFAVDRGLAGPADADDPRQLTVTTEMVDLLAARHQEQTGLPPDAATRRVLVEELVRAEVLQREARAMGLDRGDLVVQRRLAQKMEFLLESQTKLAAPSDEELLAWRDAHPQRYRRSERIRFEQRSFSSRRRGDAAQAEAEAALARLREGSDDATAGDPTARGSLPAMDPSAIDRHFGAGFAERLRELPPGQWHGPLSSRRGVHLVRVVEVIPSELPGLDELRDRLREDLLRHRRDEAREAAIDAMVEEYEIEIAADALEQEDVA